MKVVGVDAALGGWFAIVLEEGAYADAAVLADLATLLNRFQDAQAIVVDVPIGLPRLGETRRADILARQLVGIRRSSVFAAPSALALEAETYSDARAIQPSLSAQAFALRRAILDAEQHAAAISEGHPEVSFRALMDRELPFKKRTWNGQMLRRRLLADVGVELPDFLDHGSVPADDVLDAAAMAWTARRVAAEANSTLPADPAPGEPVIYY